MIDFLVEVLDLKDEPRAHSLLYNAEHLETVADHSWGTALLCLIYGDEAGVDTDRAIKLALVHDMAEFRTGDIPYRIDPEYRETSREEKAEQEEKVWEEIDGKIGGNLLDLWQEYKEKETPEAVFVKDMDLIELALRALKNEQGDRYDLENYDDAPYESLDEIFTSVGARVNTELAQKLFEKIERRYEEAKKD